MSILEQVIAAVTKTGVKSGAECYKNGDHAGLCFYPEFNDYVDLKVIGGMHALYVVTIGVLYLFMKGRPAMKLQGAMTFYNALQVFLSGLMTIMLAPNLVSGNTIFNFSGKFTASIELWVFVHYITKYLDMFDTIWMVLRHKKEQITFLHVYHHLTIGAIWGLLLHFGIGNGVTFYGAWINSLVHTLMYFHYLISSYGINNPMKKYLTQFQILQFFTCVGQAVLVFPMGESEFPTNPWAYVQLCYHCTLIVLFVNFYMKSQAKAKAARKAKAAKKD